MDQSADIDFSKKVDVARGYATLFNACAAAFLQQPTAKGVDKVHAIIRSIGDPSSIGKEDLDALSKRFNERMFVTVSPYYVPLVESSIYPSAVGTDGRVQYGPLSSSRSDHVLRCYQEVQFNMDSLNADELVKGTMRADSLGCEMAFLAYLWQGEVTNWIAGNQSVAAHWHELGQRFAREHAATWFELAAERLAGSDDDFYADVCALASVAVKSMLDE